MASANQKAQKLGLNSKVCSNRKRNGHEPLLPGAAIQLTAEEVSSILQSEKVDNEGRSILELFIKQVGGTGNGVRLSSLVNRLRREAVSLDSKLLSANDRIKEHLASIAELEAQAKWLEDQQIKIKQLRDHVDSSSFGVPSSIPSEILGEIFIACLPQHPRPIITEPPLLLCRICTIWRQIALDTPQLWSFITLSRTKDVIKLPQVAENWFSHAGALPLSLRFDTGILDAGILESSLQPSFSRPPPSNAVWSQLSNLELNAAHSNSVRSILRSIRPFIDFSKIERVAVWTDYPLFADAMNPESFPNIRKLIVSYNHPVVHHSNVLPFSNVTHLCLSGSWLSAQSWSSIIRQCIALQHGFFVIATSINAPHFEGRDTTLEHLLTLKIVLHSFGYARMMDNLHFPSLHSLSIGCVEPRKWNSKCLSPVNLNQLRSLVLYRFKILTKDLLVILRATTLLESLVIDLPIRTSRFFQEMTVKPRNSDVILPMLSTLTFFHSPSFGKSTQVFDADSFVDMVKSRWTLGTSAPTNRRRLSVVSVRTKNADVQTERTQRMLSRLPQGFLLNIGVSPNGLRVSTDVSW